MRYLLILLAASLVVLTGCEKKKNANNYGLDKSETIRLILETEPPVLDWNKSSDTTSAFVQENIMDGLVEYDYTSPTLDLEPALATSWTSNEDKTHWEFEMRQGVQWSDGREFKVQDVYDSWKRLLTPETASVYAYFLFSIKNAAEFNSGKLKEFSQVGVKTEGNKLLVDLVAPTNLPMLLTHHSTFPIRKDVIDKHGDRWTDPENIVTLGAYDLKVWDHDKAVVLKRNKTYYAEKAKTKNVLLFVIEQDSTALNLYKSGQVDALKTLSSSMLKKLKIRPDFSKHPVLSTYYFGFNTKRPPMDDANLRKAVVAAIDNSQITKMLDGGQFPIDGWIPKGMFGHLPEAGIAYDPQKALEYYKKAGYSKENPAPRIILSYNTNEDHKRIAENIQAQLRRNLNLSLEIKNEEWKVYLGTLRSNPPHMYRMGWVADYPDPHNFYELMTSTSANNYTGWKDKSFDHFLDQALKTDVKEEKLKLYSKAEQLMLVQATAVYPVYSGVSQSLVSSRLENFPANAMGRYPLKDVTIKTEEPKQTETNLTKVPSDDETT